MMVALGIGLLVLPALYAALMGWLRGGLGQSSEQVAKSSTNLDNSGEALYSSGEYLDNGSKNLYNNDGDLYNSCDDLHNNHGKVYSIDSNLYNDHKDLYNNHEGLYSSHENPYNSHQDLYSNPENLCNSGNNLNNSSDVLHNSAAELTKNGEQLAECSGQVNYEPQALGKKPALFAACSTSLTFSILIAARNEAGNLPQLLRDLAAQTLPAGCFEVLIADDHSTDATSALVTAAAQETGFTLRLIELPAAQTGKKAALLAALHAARAPWLVCTDADCCLGPGWLAAYAALLHRQPQVNFISGPVLLTGPDSLFMMLMGLEFAGLVGVGAACLARRHPTMCNGANLAYRRAAFEAVGGFADNAHLASGDDEFLLHKIHAAFPGTAHFLTDAAAIARTAAPPTLRALLRQRVRWASKWRHYQSAASRNLALLVLGANVALAAGAVALLKWPGLWPWVLAAWLLKLGGDAWLLGPVLRFFGRRKWLWGLLPLQLLYAPYALAVGAAGWRGGYEWKGRAVR